MFQCGQQCTACTDIKGGKAIKLKQSQWNINRNINCELINVIYLIVRDFQTNRVCNASDCQAIMRNIKEQEHQTQFEISGKWVIFAIEPLLLDLLEWHLDPTKV